MKQILRYSLVALLAVLTSSAYALKTVTLDFDNFRRNTLCWDISISNITVT